jgi:DnaJ-class molecular chaperone
MIQEIFAVGQSYERRRDRQTAVVTHTRGGAALLRIETGQEEWITLADAIAHWRRYEACPICRGTGQLEARQPVRRRAPVCPKCEGIGRLYS